MYCTQDDLVARFGETMLIDLTDRSVVATGEIVGDVVAAALGATDAVIDGYLLDRYLLPLSEVPPLLADIATAIAIWKLHTGMPGEKVTADYRDAIKSLEQIGKGTIKLAVAGVPQAGTSDTGAVFTDRERPLTEATMKGFI